MFGEAVGPLRDRLPLFGSPLDAGHDHRDMIGGQFAEFLGEQAGARAGHRGDPAQIEDDEIAGVDRPRSDAQHSRHSPMTTCPSGSMTRTSWTMRGEDLLLMAGGGCAATDFSADIVIGDDGAARVVACG